ncbi:hypothetical protein, partial [Acidiphilium sp.]|uniref:hypothetical protein n=1 Tax=Acidiphilium sp. TaxID=527 RepID=UPI003D03FF73
FIFFVTVEVGPKDPTMPQRANLAAPRFDGSEEIPAWADALLKSAREIDKRMDAITARRRRADYAAPTEDRQRTTDGKLRADSARSYASTERRQLQGKIDLLEHRMRHILTEPSVDDRNAYSDAHARADAVFQAALGRPAPTPTPGEHPDGYRKRLATMLATVSPELNGARLDNLSGGTLAAIEREVFADAARAVKDNSPRLGIPAGQLRAIETDWHGHKKTEYVGDPTAAWAPYSYGAGGKVSINRSLATKH